MAPLENKELEYKELFGYLNKLKNKLEIKKNPFKKDSLKSLMYSQMEEILTAENIFLKGTHKDQAKLILSPNGFPSSQSLIPDLEAMCEISKEGKEFQGIAKKFKRGMGQEEVDKREGIYWSVSEEKWDEELKIRKEQKSKLSSDIGFSVDETCDGNFELYFREDVYLQEEYDKYSREFPVMVREGKMTCQKIWESIIVGFKENFYVPNRKFELEGKQTDITRTSFENIDIFYKFGRTDYKGANLPWFFLKFRGDSIDYSKFLAAGTKSRVKTTEDILEVINSTMDKEVIIKGVKKENLEKVLAFSNIPFKNAPKLTLNNNTLNRFKGKNPTCLDLIYNSGGEKVGEIKYLLPHNYKKNSDEDDFKFILGGIGLEIYGNNISHENQEEDLKEGLLSIKPGDLKAVYEDKDDEDDYDEDEDYYDKYKRLEKKLERLKNEFGIDDEDDDEDDDDYDDDEY